MSFSDELNKYINVLNCSAQELSNKSGLSPTIISRYIHGKRTPRIGSEYFLKLINGIYEMSLKKNITINKNEIVNTLTQSFIYSNINYENFVYNFNTIIPKIGINITDLAKYLGYDPSFISRIRHASRKPYDINKFINKVSAYIASNYKNLHQKQLVINIIQCSREEIDNLEKYKSVIYNWLISKHTN